MRMPYKVALLIEKGGSTKTTTAIHIPASLAKNHGVRSLVVDLDPQLNTTRTIGPAVMSADQLTMLEMMIDPHRDIRPAIIPSSIAGVDLISGSRDLGTPEQYLLKNTKGSFRNPNTVLESVLANVPQEYDVVWIDCPPSVGLLNTNAIVAADHLLVPIEASSYGLMGFEQLALSIVRMIDERTIARPPEISVLFSRVFAKRKRNAEKRASILQIAEEAGGKAVYVFESFVRYRDAMETLPEKRKTAFDVPALREIVDDYNRVALEFMTRLEQIHASAAGAA